MNKATQTKEKLANALIEILKRSPLDLISVKRLCEQAHVGRTAFYNNFKNKEDVLKYIYRHAHKETFQDKFKDMSYVLGDDYIKDMILFFDEHSSLLEVIFRWGLIDYIAKYNTEIFMKEIKQYDDDYIRKNSEYFMVYSSIGIFHICTMWLLKNKNLSKEELYETIKHFESLYRT